MESNMKDKVSRESSSRLAVIGLALLAVLVALTLVLANMNHAYAENAGVGSADSDGAPTVQSEGASVSGLLVVSEDGVARYSTDGGISWIEGYPEGAEVQTDAQGRTTVNIGGPAPGSEALESGNLGISVNESGDGVIRYSADGGATWSEQAPDGVTVTEGPDGKVTVGSGEGPILAQQGGESAD
jgi:hypothetical protein